MVRRQHVPPFDDAGGACFKSMPVSVRLITRFQLPILRRAIALALTRSSSAQWPWCLPPDGWCSTWNTPFPLWQIHKVWPDYTAVMAEPAAAGAQLIYFLAYLSGCTHLASVFRFISSGFCVVEGKHGELACYVSQAVAEIYGCAKSVE